MEQTVMMHLYISLMMMKEVYFTAQSRPLSQHKAFIIPPSQKGDTAVMQTPSCSSQTTGRHFIITVYLEADLQCRKSRGAALISCVSLLLIISTVPFSAVNFQRTILCVNTEKQRNGTEDEAVIP